jgi:DNA helicase-2/ATP-dependent DNA helicase PcrA
LGYAQTTPAVKKTKVEVAAPKSTSDKLPATTSIPTYFSFTQLKAFENCPLQFKFAHILRIPIKGKGQFSFGKTMHATLQKMFELVTERQALVQPSLFNKDMTTIKTVGEIVKEEELDGLYETSWIDEWFENAETKAEYHAKGKKQLHVYFNLIKDQLIHPLWLEKKFNLKFGDATFRGAIDRLDEFPDGTVRIVDYKTGKAKNEDDIGFDEKEQLLVYQIACLEVLGKKPSHLTFVFLDNGTSVNFLGTDKDLDKIREYITSSIAKIRQSDFSADPGEHKCKHCDFKDICEFRAF